MSTVQSRARPLRHGERRIAPTFFFFNDTATTEIYTLSLHDALPISLIHGPARPRKVHPGLHVCASRKLRELGGRLLRRVRLLPAHRVPREPRAAPQRRTRGPR